MIILRVTNHLDWRGKKYAPGDTIELGDKYAEDTAKIFEQNGNAIRLQPEETETITDELLDLKTAEDIFNLKPSKEFIVDQLIYPQNIIMLVSPPKNYKSLFSLYLSMCITNGRKFFGLKTKKCNVLYLDKENNDSLIHQRLHAIKRGHPKLFPKKNFPLQFLIRQGDINSPNWVQKLKNTVKKHEIRLIIFDTLHRFGDYDENSANDINILYKNVFQPLIIDQNCSILFLHHTKKDGGYRGSGDLLGFVDSAYQVKKMNTDEFKIDCIAARGGEIDEIVGTVDVEQDSHKQLHSVTFIQKSHEEIVGKASEQWTKKKQACDLIMGYFKSKGLDSYRKKDIEYDILLEKKDEISKETIKSAFKYLVFKQILLSDGKGLYTKIDEWFSTTD